jgi:hypothetical protein
MVGGSREWVRAGALMAYTNKFKALYKLGA